MISYLLSQLSVALFGLPVALHPALRGESMTMRAVAAFVAGAVILTLEAILLSLLGVSWGERTLPLPVVLATAFAVWRWRGASARVALPELARPSMVTVFAIVVALVYVTSSALWSRAAVSYDSTAVVGAKAARMADARSMMLSWRRAPESAGLRPSDPPLAEVTRAWSDILLGRDTWSEAPASSVVWFLVMVAATFALARRAFGAAAAWAVAAFFSIALANGVVAARAIGGADLPFLCFTTLAAMALLSDSAPNRVLAGWSVAGMVLSRPEGVVYAFALVVFSAALRKRFLVMISLAAAALWYLPIAFAGVLTPLRASTSLSMREAMWTTSFGLALALPAIMIVSRGARALWLALPLVMIALALPSAAALMQLPSYTPSEPYTGRALLPLVAVAIAAGAQAAFGNRSPRMSSAEAER